MIKINLALRKQAAALETRDKGGGVSLSKVDLGNAAELIKDPQFRKVALGIVVAVMASYLLDGYKNDQLQKADLIVQKVTAENAKAKAELAKTAGYEALKKQFDADEELIRTKLTTIQKLMSDRQNPPKLLVSLSSGIPKEVWLSEFDMTDKDVKIKGSSLGFDQITDFMKSLGDNELISDLKLDNSQKATDPVAGEVTSFDLEAKRK